MPLTTVLASAVALGGNGYEGASIRCACGGRQKYMNDRERVLVSLLGRFRFKRAYYWCGECSESSAPLDDALAIAHTQFSPAVRNGVSLMGAEVAFGRGARLMEELTGIRISKRKHREIAEATGATLGRNQTERSDKPGVYCPKHGLAHFHARQASKRRDH